MRIEKEVVEGLTLFKTEDDQYWLGFESEDGSHALLLLNDWQLPEKQLQARVKWADECLNAKPLTLPELTKKTIVDTVVNNSSLPMTEIAVILGINRATLYRSIDKFGLKKNYVIGDNNEQTPTALEGDIE